MNAMEIGGADRAPRLALLQEQQRQALSNAVSPPTDGGKTAAAQGAAVAPQQETPLPQEGENATESAAEQMARVLSESEQEAKSLLEQMQQVRKQAEELRERFKIPKDSRRYGNAAIEAYARVARARCQAQASSAASYARRQLAQCRSALRQDGENADRIKAAIRQLQGAVTSAGRKKNQLAEEQREAKRCARAEREKQSREAMRRKQELRRKQTLRMLRENGNVQNAVISHMQQEQIAADRQAQQLRLEQIPGCGAQSASSAPPSSAAQAYTEAGAIPAAGAGGFESIG